MLNIVLAAQAAAPAAGAAGAQGGLTYALMQILPFVLIMVIFYFMLIRPQQKRMKEHQQMINNIKRGDVVVTSGGFIAKVRQVDETELRVELAPNVEVRVRKGTISEVVNKTDAPANDTK